MELIDSRFSIVLPAWVLEELRSLPERLEQDRALDFCFRLAARNAAEGDGGPFAAVVRSRAGARLISAGVNLVLGSGLSVAHAEIVALSLAQRILGTHDLRRHDLELISSCEPCAMCSGAVLWSGVSGIVYGAAGEDARAIGFDEGDKVPEWRDRLIRRGITVSGPLRREAGRTVLVDYANSGGTIYNNRITGSG